MRDEEGKVNQSRQKKQPDVLASSAQKTHLWLKDVGRELRVEDQHRAYAALRAVLHALRDCVPVEELAKFAAQLPVFVTGMLYDGWKPRRKPVRLTRRQFIDRVDEHLRGQTLEAANAVRAVLLTVSRHVSPGEVRSLRIILPREVRALWTDLEATAAGAAKQRRPPAQEEQAEAVSDEVAYESDAAPAEEPDRERGRLHRRDEQQTRQRPWRPGDLHGYR